MSEVPAERRARNPLITEAGYALLRRMLEHADAPAWNWVTGDRLEATDAETLAAIRGRPVWDVVAWVSGQRGRVPLFAEKLRGVGDLERDWHRVGTMSREDLVLRMPDVCPIDADLVRLIVYDTSGTTGHALRLPHHPVAVAANQILAEQSLETCGIRLDFGPDRAACLNVGAHVHTAILANVFSVWNDAGFAKVNLDPKDWRTGVEGARRFAGELRPWFLTGYPAAHVAAMAWALPVRPAAILSTAVELTASVRERVSAHFGCPVIDWYSTTETGPIAYHHAGAWHWTAPDLLVEVIDDDGSPVPAGTWGEITVTGGRNPYVPLLRYRTGDRGRLDAEGRLVELSGRSPVTFRAADGAPVQAVDVGRVLRDTADFVQHAFVQHADGACTLTLRPLPDVAIDLDAVTDALSRLFGDLPLCVKVDPHLGAAGKVAPYRVE